MGTVLLRDKWSVQPAPDTKVGQGLDFPAPMRCELSPVSPTPKKYRGTRKPAWIGLVPYVPYVPCVPYRKTVSRSRVASFAVLFVTGLHVRMAKQ